MHLTEKSLITNKHTQGWGKNKDEYKSTHKNKNTNIHWQLAYI